MKVLVLSDELWALARKKIEDELNCASTSAFLARAVRRREHRRLLNEAWIRKRHIEAIKLAKILKQ
jgi:hypothetical protein